MTAKTTLAAAGLLATFAVVGVGLVAATHWATRDQIAENARNRLMRGINEVLPADRYDNEPVADFVDLRDLDLLPPSGTTRIYRAFKAGRPAAAVFSIIAPDGYNGAIQLLMAVHVDGDIAGVRVLNHKETPGLGDPIDIAKSDWITRFTGYGLGNLDQTGWKVKKDGGIFDQFTGATITSRATVAAVHRGTQFFQKHQTTIFPEAPNR